MKIHFSQETVEVGQDQDQVLIFLNPDGRVNEELMMANGVNQVGKIRDTPVPAMGKNKSEGSRNISTQGI